MSWTYNSVATWEDEAMFAYAIMQEFADAVNERDVILGLPKTFPSPITATIDAADFYGDIARWIDTKYHTFVDSKTAGNVRTYYDSNRVGTGPAWHYGTLPHTAHRSEYDYTFPITAAYLYELQQNLDEMRWTDWLWDYKTSGIDTYEWSGTAMGITSASGPESGPTVSLESIWDTALVDYAAAGGSSRSGSSGGGVAYQETQGPVGGGTDSWFGPGPTDYNENNYEAYIIYGEASVVDGEITGLTAEYAAGVYFYGFTVAAHVFHAHGRDAEEDLFCLWSAEKTKTKTDTSVDSLNMLLSTKPNSLTFAGPSMEGFGEDGRKCILCWDEATDGLDFLLT